VHCAGRARGWQQPCCMPPYGIYCSQHELCEITHQKQTHLQMWHSSSPSRMPREATWADSLTAARPWPHTDAVTAVLMVWLCGLRLLPRSQSTLLLLLLVRAQGHCEGSSSVFWHNPCGVPLGVCGLCVGVGGPSHMNREG
jgi:hypothetical protein